GVMVSWSRIESLPGLYVVWFLMGLAMAATLYEPAFAAIVGWFSQHRDRALLTLTLVAGLASTIFVPIETALLARMDWRTTLVTLAVFLAVTTIPIHAFMLRPPPRPARRSSADGRGDLRGPGDRSRPARERGAPALARAHHRADGRRERDGDARAGQHRGRDLRAPELRRDQRRDGPRGERRAR